MKLKSTGRLFVFGCSFTKYYWPTWADIIGQEFEYYENWGEIGSGNLRIAHRITECVYKNQIGPNDTVFVMWSGITREDQYRNNQWHTANPDIKEHFFSNPVIDDRADTITNLGIVALAHNLLENVKCNWWATSMNGLCTFESTLLTGPSLRNVEFETLDSDTENMIENLFDLEKKLIFSTTDVNLENTLAAAPDVLKVYQKIFTQLKPSFSSYWWKTVKDVSKRPNFGDLHPSPAEHLCLVDNYFTGQVSDNTRNFVLKWQDIVENITKKDQTNPKWNPPEPNYF